MSLPQHILVIRLSAPGDVAMTIPVLHSFQKKYPGIKLTILTNRRLAALFSGLNAALVFADTRTEHKGFNGLLKLFSQLTHQNKFDAVADLHNVMRSQVIRTLFRLKGTRVAFIDKGRAEKRSLTKKKHKNLHQLTTSFERYQDVFEKLGFSFPLDFTSIYSQKPVLNDKVISLAGSKNKKWVGIAPFAAYTEKMYPLGKMEIVLRQLCQQYQIIFFGSKAESAVLEEWQKKFPGTINVAGKLNLEDELQLISHLDVMISMDSANMHFASLVNVPVVSVWGATHPFAGFMGWNQSVKNAVQLDMYCRPCSVFGNKPCYRGDHACMEELPPENIINTIVHTLRFL